MSETFKAKYRVLDTEDWCKTIAIVDSFDEAMDIMLDRVKETMGDCELSIQKLTEDGYWTAIVQAEKE